MSTYENAPATKMLATYCACCSRPLVDAISVETGIGPECRKKHGYYLEGASEEARKEANVMVHHIAIHQDGPQVVAAVARLRELGFTTLADRVLDRIGCIRIFENDGTLSVATPYREDAVKPMAAIQGRRWDRDNKVNTYPASMKRELWDVLKIYFNGMTLISKKGMAVIS